MNAIELNHACTYATPEEIYWLMGWAQKTYTPLERINHVVMIGAGPGVMAMALMEIESKYNARSIELTVIDKVSTEYVRAHIGMLANGAFIPAVDYITADSADTGKDWIGVHKLDLLIIDGDHSYEGVKRDLDAWLKHVKPNGLIFLHDYDADGTCFAGVERYPGVKQAIEECSAHWEEYARVGTAMVMKVLE